MPVSAPGVAVPPRRLSDHLLAHGRQIVTLAEVSALTGLGRREVAAAMTRLRRSGQFFSPQPGLYVAIPPQYRTWGVVPATDFIDAMMTVMGRRYYVALLSAAEMYGAAHQMPQVFQVMVDRPVADRDLGRVRLRFYTNTRLSQVPVQLHNSSTGQVRLSTPEATCLDLASRPGDCGGLSNVATVMAELAEEAGLDPAAIVDAADAYPAASLRRLGWLLEKVGAPLDLCVLRDAVRRGGAGKRPVALLDPAGPRRGHVNQGWRIVENVEVEPDL